MNTALDTSPVRTSLPSAIEQVAPGITFEWLFDHRVAVLTFKTVAMTAIDITWIRLKQVMDSWPTDHPYLAMQDFSDPNVSLTPYIRARVAEPRLWRPELGGYIALVLPPTFMFPIIQFFVRSQKEGKREVRAFNSRVKAIDWLESKV